MRHSLRHFLAASLATLSLALAIKLHAEPAKDDVPLRSPHAYALCIGINYTNIKPGVGLKLPPLNSAESDAKAIAAELSTHYNFNSTITLLGNYATRDHILARLGTLFRNLGPDDTLFLFYAGHGLSHEFDDNGVPISEGYFVPADATSAPPMNTSASFSDTFLSMRELAQAIRDQKSARHIVLAVDCCFSGFSIEPRSVTPAAARSYRKLMTNPSRIVITAGLEDQVSYEANGHGLFTTALLQALNTRVKNAQPACATELYTDLRTFADTLATNNHCEFSPQMRSLLVKSPVGEVVFLPDTATEWQSQIAAVPATSSDAPATSPEEMQSSIATAQRSADAGESTQSDPQAQKSYADYNQRASAGDPNAMAVVHYYDRLGYGAPKNPQRARVWAANTADAGLPLGQILLAQCFSEGIGGPKNSAIATLLFQKAGPNANAAFTHFGPSPRQQPTPADFIALGTAINSMSSHNPNALSPTLDKALRKKIKVVQDRYKTVKDNLDQIDADNNWSSLDHHLEDWRQSILDMKSTATGTPPAADINAIANDLLASITGMHTKELDLLRVGARREFDKSTPAMAKLQNLGKSVDAADTDAPKSKPITDHPTP